MITHRELKHAWEMDKVRENAYLSSKQQRTIMKMRLVNKHRMHIQDQNKSIIYSQWINQSVIQSWDLICRAPTKAHLSCVNQFCKFHRLKLQNLILTYFKTFLENKENSKVACRKENGNQILLKMGFWILKTLRMKALETWSYLKTRI